MADDDFDGRVPELLEVARLAALDVNGDPALAQEAADLAVTKLRDCRDALAGGDAVWRSWVRATARHHAYRAGSREAAHEANVEPLPAGPLVDVDPEDEDHSADAIMYAFLQRNQNHLSLGTPAASKADFYAAWDRLSPEASKILKMKYEFGLSLKEIADELGISEQAVGGRLYRAKEAAKPLLLELVLPFEY
jgi:RNA polymerase sigma factor (sigma-70 family)